MDEELSDKQVPGTHGDVFFEGKDDGLVYITNQTCHKCMTAYKFWKGTLDGTE
jgi:hypothetical protein